MSSICSKCKNRPAIIGMDDGAILCPTCASELMREAENRWLITFALGVVFTVMMVILIYALVH